MARLARKLDWEQAYEEDPVMQKFSKLTDEGSLENNRALLMKMGVVKQEDFRGCSPIEA